MTETEFHEFILLFDCEMMRRAELKPCVTLNECNEYIKNNAPTTSRYYSVIVDWNFGFPFLKDPLVLTKLLLVENFEIIFRDRYGYEWCRENLTFARKRRSLIDALCHAILTDVMKVDLTALKFAILYDLKK